ncbi:MAG: hypothetical protein RMJ66_01520 [Bacteroidia bacterium]|nr:WVD2 family protein [Bacteroidia bacterium]MDW8133724.1 hypothetical protein [Bacteroidia bacterium]
MSEIIYSLSVERIRWVAWLIFSSFVFTLSLTYLLPVSPIVKEFYIYIYGIGSALPLITILLCYHPSTKNKEYVKLLILYSATLPLLIEGMMTTPLSGGFFLWACTMAGLGAILLLDPAKMWNIHFLVGGHIIMAMVGILMHPFLSYLPANEMSHGIWRFAPITLMVGGGIYLAYFQYRKIPMQLRKLYGELQNLAAEQRRLLLESIEKREAAEKKHEELEAAYKELSRLQEEERKRMRKENFIIQYEALMRDSYHEELYTFARKLLEQLSMDLPVIGGLFYKREKEAWLAYRSYGFPTHEGKYVKGGLPEVAASLCRPYMIIPPPIGTLVPRSTFSVSYGRALLYLPLYSEATKETLAVVELLLAEKVEEETLSLLAQILPRIGTYLWAKQSQLV